MLLLTWFKRTLPQLRFKQPSLCIFHQIQKGHNDVQHAPPSPQSHSNPLWFGWRGGNGAHVLRREASAELGYQQAARREAGPRRLHHSVAWTLAQRHQPWGNRDRLWDPEAINTAWAGEICHDLLEEETSKAIRSVAQLNIISCYFSKAAGFVSFLSHSVCTCMCDYTWLGKHSSPAEIILNWNPDNVYT